MDAKKILSANFLDILFENRNKEYGAYDLRKSYPKRLATAIIVAASLAGFLLLMSFSLPGFTGNGKKEANTDVEIAKAVNDITPPPPPKTPPPPPKMEIKKIQLDRFTPPKFVPEDQIDDKDKVKDPEEIVNVSDQNQVGERIEVPVPVPGDDKGKVIEPPAPEPQQVEDKVYTKVEISAKYQGNWKDFLERNLVYPSDASDNGQHGVVYIEFIVDREGNISDLHVADNSPVKTPSLVAEAIRVIRKSTGKWSPGIQNDMQVRSYHQQPINFVLPDEG